MKVKFSIHFFAAIFLLFNPLPVSANDFSKCVDSFSSDQCQKIFSDPLGLGFKVSENSLKKKYGAPLKIEGVESEEKSDKRMGKKYFFRDLEIWTLSGETTICTFALIKKEIQNWPKDLQVGSTEKGLVEKLGKGKPQKGSRMYCDEEDADCLRFFFRKGKIHKIEWLPYSG